MASTNMKLNSSGFWLNSPQRCRLGWKQAGYVAEHCTRNKHKENFRAKYGEAKKYVKGDLHPLTKKKEKRSHENNKPHLFFGFYEKAEILRTSFCSA